MPPEIQAGAANHFISADLAAALVPLPCDAVWESVDEWRGGKEPAGGEPAILHSMFLARFESIFVFQIANVVEDTDADDFSTDEIFRLRGTAVLITLHCALAG